MNFKIVYLLYEILQHDFTHHGAISHEKINMRSLARNELNKTKFLNYIYKMTKL